MRKTAFTITLTLILTILMTAFVHAQDIDKLFYDGQWHSYGALPINLYVDGKNIEAPMPPIVFGEYSLVPAREVFESLGADITWNDRLMMAGISYQDTRIFLTINKATAKVNDKDIKLDIPAKIINNKTMIPARFVSEQLGFDVKWEEETRTIFIAKGQEQKVQTSTDVEVKDEEVPDIEDKEDDKITSNQLIVRSVKYISKPFSGMITNVSTGSSLTQTVQVDIEANKEIKTFETSNWQNKLIIDVFDAVLDVKEKEIKINENGIEKIRMSQFAVDPNQTRVVIDMEKKHKANVYLSSDRKHMKIDFKISTDALNPGDYTVVIDAGHGGSEPGCIRSGIYEKNLNLKIASKLVDLLEDEGINVVVTRDDDSYVDLFDRSEMANRIKADLFVSVHNNALDDNNEYKGTMTLFNPDNSLGSINKEVAQIIQKELVNEIGTKDLGLRERPGLAVLRTAEVPAVLVEVAFMSNPSELTNLKKSSFQKSAAEGLKNGIIKALIELYN